MRYTTELCHLPVQVFFFLKKNTENEKSLALFSYVHMTVQLSVCKRTFSRKRADIKIEHSFVIKDFFYLLKV